MVNQILEELGGENYLIITLGAHTITYDHKYGGLSFRVGTRTVVSITKLSATWYTGFLYQDGDRQWKSPLQGGFSAKEVLEKLVGPLPW